jgi:sugar/nucleoside kinase (ribokinase family)
MRAALTIRGKEREPKAFDAICAGATTWKLARDGVSLRPAGGAMRVARALAQRGLRVGLATALTDDAPGRRFREALAASGVDVGGVMFTPPRSAVVLVDARGGTREHLSDEEQEPPITVPAEWSSQLLVLSGLSPVVAQVAALCRAARAARRHGALAILDFDANLHAWAGRDPRTIQMVLREIDVARCSLADLAVLGTEVAAVRARLRPSAVLVVSDAAGRAVASGPFGEVTVARPTPRRRTTGAAQTAAICAEFARAGAPGESVSARWHRALSHGYAGPEEPQSR